MTPVPAIPAVYFDMDGVLFDFDAGLTTLGLVPDPALNRSKEELDGPQRAAKKAIYDAIRDTDFYADLPLMPGARDLWAACAHLFPGVITAAPRFGGGKDSPAFLRAAAGKRTAIERHFGPIADDRFVCTISCEKPLHLGMLPGAPQILIDDRPANTRAWADAGGIGLLHRDAGSTLAALRELIGPHLLAA